LKVKRQEYNGERGSQWGNFSDIWGVEVGSSMHRCLPSNPNLKNVLKTLKKQGRGLQFIVKDYAGCCKLE